MPKTVDNRIRGKLHQHLEKGSPIMDWNNDGHPDAHGVNFRPDTGNFIRSLESQASCLELKRLMEEAVYLSKWAAQLRLSRYETYPRAGSDIGPVAK